ncbi:hypothetical protein GCM10027418_16650 [Mariniluteicoccus endophyticus]
MKITRKFLAALAAGVVVGSPVAAAPFLASAQAASTAYSNLTGEQKANGKAIVEASKKLGMNERAMAIAIATALQESSLRNLDWGDRDSVGLYQQRPSMGWGTIAEIRDVHKATAAFYGVAKHTNNPGLTDVKGWESMPLSVAAQKVQRSAYPDAYAKWESLAKEIVAINTTKPTTKPTKKPTVVSTPKATTIKVTGTPRGTVKPSSTSKPTVSGTPRGTATPSTAGKPSTTHKPSLPGTPRATAKPSSPAKPTAPATTMPPKPGTTLTPRKPSTPKQTLQPGTGRPTTAPASPRATTSPEVPPTDQPVTDQPVTDQPVNDVRVDEPVGDEPVGDTPVSDQPAGEPQAADVPADMPADAPADMPVDEAPADSGTPTSSDVQDDKGLADTGAPMSPGVIGASVAAIAAGALLLRRRRS